MPGQQHQETALPGTSLALSMGILGPRSDFKHFPVAIFFICNTERIFLMSQNNIKQIDSKDSTSKLNQNVVAVPT